MKEAEVRIRNLCKKYREVKHAFPAAVVELNNLESRCNSEGNENTVRKQMMSYSVERKKKQIQGMKEIIEMFENSIIMLPEAERDVIKQLYAEGKEWGEVVDFTGEKYSIKQITSIRKRALRRMSKYV